MIMAAPKKWTAEKMELLRRLYPSNLTKDIAHLFDATPKAVSHMAYRCGIRKNPEIRAMNGKACQFQKGHVPFNKGKKWYEFMSEEGHKNSVRAQFKSGDIPFNTRPMYSERFSKNGYIEIKIPVHNKYVLKHRWVWESHNGPIPKGCQIHFLDGNRTNCDISNLEMITHAENARRNGTWNKYPKEIASLIQLKGALNRQINKKKKLNQ